MAAEASRSGGGSAADSYIGSLISLTSKYEIRYEGVLYNINTEESSIGLRNVRSFGTEGRKKDGPQIPPSDKVYEYILFRGSDIKDLQVKSSPPVQTTAPIHNDPAIIQSHYSRPPSISTSLPPSGSGSATDPIAHSTQMGLPRPTFQGGIPLYQPGGSLGSWGSAPPPPPNASGNGLAVPMYWQGFYGPSSGIPPMQQQPLFRPPPNLSGNPVQQPMQYSGVNPSSTTVASNLPPSNFPPSNLPTSNLPASNLQSNLSASKLPEFPSPLLPPVSSGDSSLTSSTLTSIPPTLVPSQSVSLASETSPIMMPNKAPSAAISTATLSGYMPLVSPLGTSSMDINTIVPPISNKPKNITGSSLPYQTISQPASIVGTSSSSHTEASVPSLVTPGQLLQPASAAMSSSQTSQPAHKDVEVVQVPSSSERPPSPPKEVQAPLLPLPSPPDQKLNGPSLHTRSYHGYRGRERGRGNGILRPVTKFVEEFDFTAMNEKFKKDEVWGHLGKSNTEKMGGGEDNDGDYSHEEDDAGSSNIESKPVYVKDDFFDSLSCNSLDHGSRNGRTKFSEQMKIDTETFGEFPRHHRGGRGGRGPGRGGRSRGPFYGRGYGYVGRGRGQPMPNRGN